MSRMWIFFVVVAYPVIAVSQTGSSGTSGSNAYQPVVPAASSVGTYGGWPGYTTGGTAAGNALNGMASAISAAGDYNLATSAAAVNMTQAQRNEIQNRQQWTSAYFDMRTTNRAAREAERGKTPTMEQIARMAREGAPKPLSPNQVDPVTGQIYWPSALRQDIFRVERGEVDRVFAARARYGGLSYLDQSAARQAIDGMFDGLKTHIAEMPPPEYMACRNFLQSLSYAALKMELD